MSHAADQLKLNHAVEAKALAGTATDTHKTNVIRSFAYFVKGKHFAGHVSERIQILCYDVQTDATGREAAELEMALRVEEDMINGFGTLHGGCSAYLVDVCTSICLLGLVSGHVTLTMDIVCHAAAQQGAMLRLVARTTSVGKRVLSTRCEISDKDTGRLYVTGTHIKMPIASKPKL